MNPKQIGTILFIAGIILAVFTSTMKLREDRNIELLITAQGGSCYLPDGTCLHDDRSYTLFIIGWVLGGVLAIIGIYLFFFDNTQKQLAEHQRQVSSALAHAKKHEREQNEFAAFLAAFTQEEQQVIRAVHEQEGILQSTLRYKTGMSKTALSLLLGSLEERAIITRTQSGKSNKLFLRKKF